MFVSISAVYVQLIWNLLLLGTLFGKEAEDDDQEPQASDRVHEKAGCKNATEGKASEKLNDNERPEVLSGAKNGDDSRKMKKRNCVEEGERRANEKAVNENGRPEASSGGGDSRKTKKRKHIEEEEGKASEKVVNENGRPEASTGRKNGDDSKKTKKTKKRGKRVRRQ